MDKFFKISERGSNVRTEIIAGLTTFFAMAYIVVTNPNQIVSFNHLAPDADPAFQQIWNAVYVASILAAIIGTLLMALYAKMPFAQACGMGLNSFFFVSFILPEIISGGDVIKGYHAGLVIILVSGFVFLLFSVTGLRVKVAKALPDCLKKAIPAGIGLFIAFLGFQNVGIIQTNQYTLVQFVDIHGALKAGAFFADVEGVKAFMPAILAFLGLLVIAILEKHNVKGGVLIDLGGSDDADGLLLEAHADTLGGMVAEIKGTGRLRLTALGGMRPENGEAENVRVYTRSGRVIEGTFQLCNASVHVNDDYAGTKRSYDTCEVVLDEDVKSADDTRALGVETGDIVCFEPRTRITSSGYIKSRFLDDKLSVGILLGLGK